MNFNLKKRKRLGVLLLSLIIMACNKKIEETKDVLFSIESFDADKDSILTVKLINNSSNNYFITIDTNRTYDYSAFNYKINNSIILRPTIYLDGKIITLKGKGFMQKTIGIDKGKMDCINREVFQSDTIYNNYIILKNAIFLKKNSSLEMEIPFNLKYSSCYFTYDYDLKKGNKYELQLKYQMLKETTEKWIDKSKLDSVIKLGYVPYYEKIVSNKVPFMIKK